MAEWKHIEPRTVVSEVGEADELNEYYPDWASEDGGHDFGYHFEARITPPGKWASSRLNVEIGFRECDPAHAKEFSASLLKLVREFFIEDPKSYDWSKTDVKKMRGPIFDATPEGETE